MGGYSCVALQAEDCMHKNQYLIDICIMEGCTVLDDSCTECGTPEDWEQAMTQQLEGRQLDAAIAERVFGLDVCKHRERYAIWRDGKFVISERMANYSTNMGVAWQVAEWIREQTGYFSLTWWSGLNRWQCEYRPGNDITEEYFFAPGVTAPEAVCHAALKLAEQLEG